MESQNVEEKIVCVCKKEFTEQTIFKHLHHRTNKSCKEKFDKEKYEILVAASVVDNLAIGEVGLCLILLLLEHLGAMAIGFNRSSTTCCHSRVLRLVSFGRLHAHWDITAFKLLGQLVLIEG